MYHVNTMSCSIPMANILMNKSSIELAVNNHGLRIKFQRKMCNGCHVSKSIKSEGPNVRKMRKISYSYSLFFYQLVTSISGARLQLEKMQFFHNLLFQIL